MPNPLLKALELAGFLMLCTLFVIANLVNPNPLRQLYSQYQ